MTLSNFIRPEHVFAAFTAASKQKLLQALSKIAGKALDIPEGVIFESLHTREKLGGTGIGTAPPSLIRASRVSRNRSACSFVSKSPSISRP